MTTTKTFIANAITFAGSQAAIILSGVIVGMALGWDPKFAADVTVETQMLFAGFIIRGWFC